MSSLDLFSAPTRAWFESSFPAPTEVQERGWRSVSEGRHTLMTAPTGSGKTLAAFLWCLDRLTQGPEPPELERCRVLYVSPLKALAVDVERNLRAPLRGIARQSELLGLPVPSLRVAIRTGDTPQDERRQMERHPPDILITTPESLFLLLTSQARLRLTSVRWVIVDEIHAVAATKRGAHLALSLERLQAICTDDPQRIGLSATQRPLEETGRFLGGAGRDVEIIDASRRKALEISVEVPVEDMTDPGRGMPAPAGPPSGAAAALGTDLSPRHSIWPAVYPRLLELIRRHRSTIIFVNSRRLAERLAARIDELAEEEVALAHHGSISREQRTIAEDRLKAGTLPALVATSSLELGIDMGAVDLVIHVESPPSVAAGIQRIGRAGHSVGDVSKGTVFPKFRGDLLTAATVVERIHGALIEETVVPENPLDVLAQQVVAMAAMDTWPVEELEALVRRAHPFRRLGRRSLDAVLDMLAGRYPSEEFAGLRPRIVWDREHGQIRGRAGSQRLVVTNPGTIPDRGMYTVNLLSDGRRVGELDEEMVFETHPGETFVLGATTWRVAEVTPSQVLVEPAPGEPGKIAFWKGDSLSRPAELGEAIGRMARELREAAPEAAQERLREGCGFNAAATANLLAYLRDQYEACGAVPDDRTIVVERFRDEIGDWRVCVLSPWGGKVHAPWAMAIRRRLQERSGLEVQTFYTDDGLALRLPDADRPLDVEDLMIEPEEIRELVSAQLPGSSLFAGRFRENAARALLLPRRRPGQRQPLWQQRQRAGDLLQVAARFPDFPILAETYRECLIDAFDLEALRRLLTGIRSRQIRIVAVDGERASPFAASLLFDYVGNYLYEGDAPLAERRAQALTLDRELLEELMGTEELRELLDPDVVSELELELQGLIRERWPRDADEAHDLISRLGDLSEPELAARGVGAGWLRELRDERRIIPVRVAGEARWIVAEDAGRYRDALGVALPVGLPEAFLEPVDDALIALLRRWSRSQLPFVTAQPRVRWGLAEDAVRTALEALVRSGHLLVGDFGVRNDREYCQPDILRTLRRRSLATLRREAEPVDQVALARFLPRWHGIGAEGTDMDRLLQCVEALQGLALPASAIERDILSARLSDYRGSLLDELLAMGEVVWIGRGALGPSDGRVALHLREDVARLLPPPADLPDGELHQRLREHLSRRGARFFRELSTALRPADPDALLDALWEMVWAGEVTNDTFTPLRAGAHAARARQPNRRAPLLRTGPPRAAGRWSLVADLLPEVPSDTERLYSRAMMLLRRHGVLTREAVLGEGIEGGFAQLYPVLRTMEEAGKVRRGYFVDGLGGSQFALPGAVDRLRACRKPDGQIVALSAIDPANPYGAVLGWPESDARFSRAAGAYVVLESGELRCYLERGGRTLHTVGGIFPDHVRELITVATRAGRVEVQRVDGLPASESPLSPVLREAGFSVTPRGLVAWTNPG